MKYCTKSSFLKEIPKQYFHATTDFYTQTTPTSPTQRTHTGKHAENRSTFTPSPTSLVRLTKQTVNPSVTHNQSMLQNELNISDIVEHDRFGLGTVIAVEGTGNSAKAVVDFEGVGQKTLLLSFAKLKKMTQAR